MRLLADFNLALCICDACLFEAHERGVLPPDLDIRSVILRFFCASLGFGFVAVGFGQVNCDILIGLLSRAVQQRRKAFEEA